MSTIQRTMEASAPRPAHPARPAGSAGPTAGELLDQRGFRDTMGRYPTGVVVIAAMTPTGRAGLAVNSFTSVSLDPPLVAFCPMLTSTSWARLRPVGGFAVSLLREDHESIARRFSQKGIDRFAEHDWVESPAGHPVLADALGWLDTTVESISLAGDHEVVIARVDHWSQVDDGRPLVFFGGRYHRLP